MDEARYREAERRLWASLGADPVERRLRLERTAVTVRVQELGDGPPVLFVHGANTSGSSWASLAARMGGFRSIVLDRPGTGLSGALRSALRAETLPAFAEALVVDVLDALGLDRAHLVATSFGGYIALRTAAAHPDRVGRMVQFSWPAGAPVARVPGFMRLGTFPVLGRVLAALPATERTVRMTFRRIGHGPSLDDGRITAQDLETYLALLRHTATMRNELALGRAFVSPIRGLDRIVLPDAVLGSIRTPTRFLWGELDPFGGPDDARRVVGLIPNAELEVLGRAGHAPWLDDLAHCTASTRAFLAG